MFERIKTISQLASWLGVGASQLKSLKPESHYACFKIPKPGTDEKRTIEAPTGVLKFMLDRLADGLQWTYSDHRTPVAHGYIRSVKNDPDKRTIFTNAKKHLRKKYLLNIDLDNFFHQIAEEKVQAIFTDNRFFAFNNDTISLLVKMVCYNGRLPMGSPTSPPLSNFATIDLDRDLAFWAIQQRIVYTRFVDDLSFSSNNPLTENHLDIINDTLKMHHFKPDPDKIKWYGKDDVKEVTGLIVSDKIGLPEAYFEDLEKEIKRLREIKLNALLYPEHAVFEWIQKLEEIVGGRLAFAKTACGKESQVYKKLLSSFMATNAIEPEELSVSWRYAGYEYFT